MRCPKCHADNPDTSRFCGNCATALTTFKPTQPAITETLQSPTRIVAPGTIFAGRYEILDSIGAGGMGEVYRALDKNLGRQVAIKILPAAFAEDKERMARFEREAKLLAALNHPNIAAIHGLEESEGRRFLVLELAEGETLQSRLDREPLHVEEALEACREIAEGLEAAHEKGIVHRDLKPGNIMLTSDGKVKILDFGLAKAYGAETTNIDIATSPTITAQMTEPGVILGTAAYMSPEQARGRPVDKRTDIWAFGCVLYECLTGARAFHGETVSDTLAHILKGEPDWSRLPQDTPVRIRTLLRHCLEKNPKERLRDIGDARIEISEAIGQPSAPEAVLIRRPGRAWILGGIICVLAVGAIATFVMWHIKRAPSPTVGRLTLKLNTGLWLTGVRRVEFQRPTRTAFAFSGDGRFIVYSAIQENPEPQAKSQIYLRRLDQSEATPVSGTEGGIYPFLSPDDRWIGFYAGGKLNKVPLSGGVPVPLCDGEPDADWGPDNVIVFSQDHRGLSKISSEGGKSEILTVPDKAAGELLHHLPHWLPDGRSLLFTIANSYYGVFSRLAVFDLRSRTWRVIMEDAADGRYIRTGHLVFLRQGTLMAVRFDLDRREVKGQPIPIVTNVMQALNISNVAYNSGAGQYSVSKSGWLAYAPGGIFPDPENSLVKVSQKGEVQPAVDFKSPFFAPRFSPDGKRIIYQTIGLDKFVWIYDLNRTTATPVTREGIANFVIWAPDGKRVVFAWTKSAPFNLYRQPADGSSPMEQLTTSEYDQFPGSFTPDGLTLAFVEDRPKTGADILLLNVKSGKVTPFVNSSADEGWPEFSPDGRWLTYNSDESGRNEVWVRPFPGPGGRWQISKEGGWQPIWSKDGNQIFYKRADQVWAVDVRTEGGFSAGKPRLLFERNGLGGGTPIRSWDLWPEGQGFLMVKGDERKPDPVTEINVVQNWFEELKRLVPAGKK
jgi:Tol biopolymer transport system component